MKNIKNILAFTLGVATTAGAVLIASCEKESKENEKLEKEDAELLEKYRNDQRTASTLQDIKKSLIQDEITDAEKKVLYKKLEEVEINNRVDILYLMTHPRFDNHIYPQLNDSDRDIAHEIYHNFRQEQKHNVVEDKTVKEDIQKLKLDEIQ